jgi:hypothetical protein
MSRLLIAAIALAALLLLVVVLVVYVRWRGHQPVPWTNSVASGEMRSKLYPSANYRCCSSGSWACTDKGCGDGVWADANVCGKITHDQDSALSSSCESSLLGSL